MTPFQGQQYVKLQPVALHAKVPLTRLIMTNQKIPHQTVSFQAIL